MGPSLRLALALSACAALAPQAAAHSPHDVVTELALSPGFATDRTLFIAVTLTDNLLVGVSRDAGRSFRLVGTPLAAPDVRGFAFSPDFTRDGTAFAANPKSGVWRTQDGGLSWQPASAGLGSLAVQGVACSPDFATDRRVLAATTAGAWVSHDGGDTWSPASAGLAESALRRVAIVRDGQGGLTAYAVGKVLHRSTDLGQSWVPLGTFAQPVESLALSPQFAADARLAVSFGRQGLGVALSSDAGDSFQFKNDGLSDLFVEEVAIADDGTLFAVTDTAGCFRADSPAAPWTLQVQGFEALSDLTAVHHTEVVPAPDFARDGTLFVGAFEGLYRSTDRAESFRQLDVYSQRLNRRFVSAPGQPAESGLLLGNYGGGVFRYARELLPDGPPTGGAAGGTATGSVAAGAALSKPPSGAPPAAPPSQPAPWTWESRANGISAPWSSVLAASPGPPGGRTLLYGYNGLVQSTDEGLDWTSANKPAAVQVVRAAGFSPDWARDRTAFLGSGMTGCYRTQDACQSWQLVSGLPFTMATTAIRVSPGWVADGTVFFASRNFGVWRSTDRGETWVACNDGLSSTKVKALEMSPGFGSDGTLVAGLIDGGLFVSTDAGASWQAAVAGLPPGTSHVESLALSPGFPGDGTLFAALQDHGVWRSSDGAATWQPCGGGLPGPPVELAVSPAFATDRTVLVGTFGGTMVSRDAGLTWEPLPGWVRVDDLHPSVAASGAWDTVASGANLAAAWSETSQPGDFTELEFEGRHVSWWGRSGPDGALAQFSLDGGPPLVVDTRSDAVQEQVELFTHDFGAVGWHVLRVTHGGSSLRGGGAAVLRSDGFEHGW